MSQLLALNPGLPRRSLGSRMHLLLIEDDAEAAKYLAKGLRESGYTVDIAANGRDGLFQATEETYELIIADRHKLLVPWRPALEHFAGKGLKGALRRQTLSWKLERGIGIGLPPM